MQIVKYNPGHEEAVMAALEKEPGWSIFTGDGAADRYKASLRRGVTYVCMNNNDFCGYVRALLDDGFAVYVSELYVTPEWRNKKIGRSLLEKVKKEFPGLTVYALSDEDAYYEKLGYKRIGSVFGID
jgi:GNAT superfamily N-acetyltransferase